MLYYLVYKSMYYTREYNLLGERNVRIESDTGNVIYIMMEFKQNGPDDPLCFFFHRRNAETCEVKGRPDVLPRNIVRPHAHSEHGADLPQTEKS